MLLSTWNHVTLLYACVRKTFYCKSLQTYWPLFVWYTRLLWTTPQFKLKCFRYYRWDDVNCSLTESCWVCWRWICFYIIEWTTAISSSDWKTQSSCYPYSLRNKDAIHTYTIRWSSFEVTGTDNQSTNCLCFGSVLLHLLIWSFILTGACHYYQSVVMILMKRQRSKNSPFSRMTFTGGLHWLYDIWCDVTGRGVMPKIPTFGLSFIKKAFPDPCLVHGTSNRAK